MLVSSHQIFEWAFSLHLLRSKELALSNGQIVERHTNLPKYTQMKLPSPSYLGRRDLSPLGLSSIAYPSILDNPWCTVWRTFLKTTKLLLRIYQVNAPFQSHIWKTFNNFLLATFWYGLVISRYRKFPRCFIYKWTPQMPLVHIFDVQFLVWWSGGIEFKNRPKGVLPWVLNNHHLR